MKIISAFPDDSYEKSLLTDVSVPAYELKKLGVLCCNQTEFMTHHLHDIEKDDILIWWIGTRNEDWIDILTKLECRKFLRNIDTHKTDGLLFNREREIFHRIGFEAMLVAYCTDSNSNLLKDLGINHIEYPHLLDTSKSRPINISQKQDIIVSGNTSENSYPVRHKISSTLIQEFHTRQQTKTKYPWSIAVLPHPGYHFHNARHQVYGEKYIDVLSQFKLAVICSGLRSSLYAKYIEFAIAGTLPIGNAPDNLPAAAKNAMILINDDMSKDDIVNAVDSIIHDEDEITSRTLQYRNVMKIYDISETKNILDKIIKGTYKQ